MARKKGRMMDAVMGQGPMLIEFYRNNPCIAAYDLLGVDLAPIQRIVFEDMWFRDYTITVAGRGFGKSFLLGTLAALRAMLYPGYRVGLVGPSFRQSKMIFSEVEKHYTKSAILREATEKKPIRGSDTAYLKFKSVGSSNGSFIEAIPLGNDGAKIRGSRFYLICIDELAQVPDKILDMVLRPMGATKQDPMANVRRLEQMRLLIESGLATEDDFDDDQVNKMVMTSSGFYKFNHMYRRMRAYWDKIIQEGEEESNVMVHQIPHWFLPKGFLDENNIEEARRVMSDHEFRMEYEAEMVSDSEGFFKASMLEACTSNSGHYLELSGDSKAEYVIGVDPNQGGSASCGVSIVKLGQPNRIVNMLEVKNGTTQGMVTTLQSVCKTYNVIRIYMDKAGGGKAICDLLEEGYNGATPIIDRTNPDHSHWKGKHILELINFTPQWIQEANYSTLSLFEDRLLLFPERMPDGSDQLDEQYAAIYELKKQLLSIILTQTGSGVLHFDTPKKGQNKDLYSSLILAGFGAKELSKPVDTVLDPVLHSSGGMIRERTPNSSFREIAKSITNVASNTNMSMAILKKKIK